MKNLYLALQLEEHADREKLERACNDLRRGNSADADEISSIMQDDQRRQIYDNIHAQFRILGNALAGEVGESLCGSTSKFNDSNLWQRRLVEFSD